MNPSKSKVARAIDQGPPMQKGDFAVWQRDTLRILHLECQTRWELRYANGDWDFMQRLQNLRERIFPSGSGRRFYFDKFRDNLVRLYDKMLIHRENKRTSRRTLEKGYPTWIREVEPRFYSPLSKEIKGQIHWVIPLTKGPVHLLMSTLQSLENQEYQGWNAWIVVEGKQQLELGLQGQDPRIRIIRNEDGADWRAAVWTRLKPYSSGESEDPLFFGVLQPGDRLFPRATDKFLEAAGADKDIGCVFSEEDQIDVQRGTRQNPWFKPDFDMESFLETRSLGSAFIVDILETDKVGGWFQSHDGSDSEQDLIWRLIGRGKSVEHIHLVLLHRFGAIRHAETNAMVLSARKALDILNRKAVVGPGTFSGTCEVRPIQTQRPMVSVLIPNKDQPEMLKSCIDSILGADYPELEILIIENGSKEKATHNLYQKLKSKNNIQVLPWTENFNYSAVNNYAAKIAKGELLLLMNNDVTTTGKDWLLRLVDQTLEPTIGAVGPMLLYPDGRIQHAGCVLGVEGTNGHRLRFADPGQRGYGDLLAVTREMTAVTGACLMVSKEAYFQVGGMDEFLALTFNDIDLCLKLNRLGKRNILLPRIRLIHHECITRGHDITPQKRARLACEEEYFCRKWGPMAEMDRFHSPFLTSMHSILWLKPPVNLEFHNAAA